MIASLPMYDRPSTSGANDRLWKAIREAYGRGPADLDRSEDPHVTWERDDLVLSQTCGLPYRSGLHGRVHLVGTPDYGVPGCPPGYYRSCLVVRADDPRRTTADLAEAVLARNDIRSQSGWAAFTAHLAAEGISRAPESPILDTGSHAASARAVHDGRADVAALDAVSWTLLRREESWTQRLRVLAVTAPTPGLPLITGPREDADRLFAAVRSAIAALAADDRAALLLKDIVRIAPHHYLDVPMP
jgi:ABC-type phosphate/phosphonate transport system substrate-binding protein